MTRKFLFLIMILVFSNYYNFSQEDSLSHEISGEVKELSDFHDIIYPIWHTAYPEKDYKALRGYVPEVNKLAENLYSAKLPGILREKQVKWNMGLTELKKAVKDFNYSAQGTNDDSLLLAAENLHSKFEIMVRIIRPVLKEVDEFHKVLYVVYHKDLPDKNYDAIKAAGKVFIEKANAITKAKLSKRLENKSEKFQIAAADLLFASKELDKICAEGVNEKITFAVNNLHTKYQNLEKIFE